MKNITKNHVKEAVAGLTVLALTAALSLWVGSLAAQATEEPDATICTPVFETQDNPDYVAEQVIEHEAVYEYIEHDAEYATEHEYAKQVKGKVQKKGLFGWTDKGNFDWETWSGGSTRWEGGGFSESGPHNSVQSTWTEGSWPFKTDWRKISTDYRYAATGETRQGDLIDAAWTEEVLVTAAWTETIPAQGEPTIEVQVGEECITPEPTPEPEVTPEPTPDVTPEPKPEPAAEEFTIVSGVGPVEVTEATEAPVATAVAAEATFTG